MPRTLRVAAARVMQVLQVLQEAPLKAHAIFLRGPAIHVYIYMCIYVYMYVCVCVCVYMHISRYISRYMYMTYT
jgi:hypothetical protein